jgi:hypothetical protein
MCVPGKVLWLFSTANPKEKQRQSKNMLKLNPLLNDKMLTSRDPAIKE